MAKTTARTKQRKERGIALLLTLFALLLLSAIGLCMVLSSDTETRIDANYGSSLKAYYAAKSGLEEVRDRVRYPATSASPGGLADSLPQNVAGNAQGVLYIVNPAGENVDPTDSSSPYFDDQLCHDYNSGTPRGVKCTVVPSATNWLMPAQLAKIPPSGVPLGYKWVRINMKTNRIADPYFVDQTGASASLDTRVCWDGQTEQLSPGGLNPSCDANGMQTVYMLTALAATPQANGPNGAKKLLRAEVVMPSIRPPGMLTMGASGIAPVLTSGTGIPSVFVDGRVHGLDGTLATGGGCSAIAPLATNSANGTSQLEQALNQLRLSIVQTANTSCQADGNPLNGKECSFGLWWVRGTDADPRFVTSDSSGSSPSGSGDSSGSSGSSDSSDLSGSSDLLSSSDSLSAGSSGDSGLAGFDLSGDSGSDDSHGSRHGDGHHHHHPPTGVPDSGACDPANPACYTNLNLSAPELLAASAVPGEHLPVMTLSSGSNALFSGNRGNQADATVYQPAARQIVQNEIAAVNNLVTASVNKPNYFSVSSGSLAASYGTSTEPAVVVISDPTLSLQNSLSGFGVLVVPPNGLEISGTLNWTGIVLVNSSSGHITIKQGASGYINGALLVQPGAAVNIQNSQGQFRLTYSCDAVDLPFNAQPVKVISTAEASF